MKRVRDFLRYLFIRKNLLHLAWTFVLILGVEILLNWMLEGCMPHVIPAAFCALALSLAEMLRRFAQTLYMLDGRRSKIFFGLAAIFFYLSFKVLNFM